MRYVNFSIYLERSEGAGFTARAEANAKARKGCDTVAMFEV